MAEVIAHGETRRSWLAFCSGVRHATHVAEEFRRRGVSCATIFGKTPKDERDRIIAAFKRGEIRALASMGVLTTGFNAPAVDLIAMLRPTKSAGLYVQMAGRGTRLAAGKENCLVLDFAGNVRRHGPIDLVRPKRPGGPGDGPPPTKICPECGTIVAIAALECPGCGFEFPGREVKLEPTASTLEVLSTGKPQWVAVTDVTYSRHEKRGGRVSLKVTYRCGLAFHTEWVCFEHEGYPRRKAASWWRERAPDLKIPASVDEALIAGGRAASPHRDRRPPRGPLHRNHRLQVRPMPYLRAGLCAVCHREPRGWGWFDARFCRLRPAARHEPPRPLQPRLPGHLPPEVGHDRSDPQRDGGHGRGGQGRRRLSRQSRPRTDLALLTEEEWDTFVEVIVTGYCDHLRELAAKDRARLDGMIPEVPF
ncbi:MAG: hypothetical protein KatS3mg118_3356 [Paracoccaceae bacterium]|nr:MAG: hypothetical protein KatS3mg118_3356 [Paracoccaceae bacterium]